MIELIKVIMLMKRNAENKSIKVSDILKWNEQYNIHWK